MKIYTIIGGVNGCGKSSLTGALKAERRDLGIIIDVDKLTKDRRPAWLTELQQALKSMEVCPCR